jgi:Ni,Fe-hydrogenase III small subunit
MRWWPLYGLKKRLTERAAYISPVEVKTLWNGLFRRSFFVYVIDVGSCNALNFEISALESPQYNIHRFGIFLTDSPRHADLLLVLGRPVPGMMEPLRETISQLPKPYGIVCIDDSEDMPGLADYPDFVHPVTLIRGVPNPSQILGMLLDLSKTKRNPS